MANLEWSGNNVLLHIDVDDRERYVHVREGSSIGPLWRAPTGWINRQPQSVLAYVFGRGMEMRSNRACPRPIWLGCLGVAWVALGATFDATSQGSPPGGNECEHCMPLAEGTVNGTTTDNTGTTGDDTSCGLDDTIDKWYCFTATCAFSAEISTCNQADFDTTLAVFEGGCDGPEVACNDNGPGCAGSTSLVTFPTSADTEYWVRVSGSDGASGNYTLSFFGHCDPPPPPACDLDDPGAANCQTYVTDNATESNDTAFTSADNFVTSTSGSIDNICWWGTYSPNPWVDTFVVTYYADSGGIPGGVVGGPFYQVDGSLDVYGPVDTGDLIGGVTPIWEYSGAHAPVSVNAFDCLWVEVKNNPAGVTWSWVWSFFGDLYTVIDEGPDGYDLGDATSGHDFAWCINLDLGGLAICEPPPPPSCGDPNAGDCDTPNGTPACDDLSCCEFVCSLDPFCCNVQWNQNCVDAALAKCDLTPTGACCVFANCSVQTKPECDALGGLYLGDDTCCADPVAGSCGIPVCGPGSGPCNVPNGTPGCDNESCCCAICAADPFCCDVEWDGICATSAANQSACQTPPDCQGGYVCDYFAGACCCCPEETCNITMEGDCLSPNCTYQGDGTDCGVPGGDVNSYNANVGQGIPNGPGGVLTHEFNVPDSFNIVDVDVTLNISHTWVGDLCVTISHLGTDVIIVQRIGDPGLGCDGGCCGCSENDVLGSCNDEGGSGPIENACPPTGGDYTPQNPLSAFDNMDSFGTWTITIGDNTAADTGTLNSWGLNIQEPAGGPGVCDDLHCEYCGDGIVDPVEECDDGNVTDGDCCSSLCTLEASGSNCGDGATECSGQDTCDGTGNCDANDSDTTTTCGDAATGCSDQDTCDGNGGCTNENDVANGTDCGAGATECSGQDFCSLGVCLPNDLASGTPCGSPGDECASSDTCSGGGVCNPGVVIVDCINDDGCCAAGCVTENDNDCPLDVPTVSTWGLLIFVLLLLAGSKVYFGRRRHTA